VINRTADLIWSVEPVRFGLVTYNQSLSDYFLRSRDIVLRPGMTPADLLPADYAVRWHELYTRALKEGTFTTEYTVVSQDRVLQLSLNVIKRRGEVIGISVFGRDITEMKRITSSLLESEERFRCISGPSLAGIYILQDGKLVYVNPALAGIFGYDPAELIGQHPLRLIHPDDHELVRENIRRRVSGEVASLLYTFRGLRKDGAVVDVEVLGGVIELKGRPAIIGNILDITERKRAEKKLRQLSQIVEQAPLAVIITDLEGHIEYVNPRFTAG